MLTLDLDRLGISAGEVVLDLGCGNGRHTFAALKLGAHVIAVDLETAVLAHVDEWVEAMRSEGEISGQTSFLPIVGDARHLPLPDESIDHVIVSEVLEHIYEDDAAIAEVARILKPGAGAGVTVPRFWPERVCWALSERYRTTVGGHVRIYTEAALKDKLHGNGLDVVGRSHAHSFHSPYWWLKCAFGDDGTAPVPRLYHRFLVWQITKQPPLLDTLERALDPLLGKSLVLYTRKNGVTGHLVG
ncbi:MAG: class I SAM-dependent methyltransferase [Actinomycetota bacterium]